MLMDNSCLEEAHRYFTEQGNRLAETLQSYNAILRYILDSGMAKGETVQELRLFLSKTSLFPETAAVFAAQAGNLISDLITEIDLADRYHEI